MQVEVHSFESLYFRAKTPFAPGSVLVSIGDPGTLPPTLAHKPDHTLRLLFEDMTAELAVVRLGLPPRWLEDEQTLAAELSRRNTVLFNDAMATRTAAFLRRHLTGDGTLYCQCEFGQSRSAAVAAAVLEHFEGRGGEIFTDRRYGPNPLVYQKLLAALRSAEKQESP